MLLMTRTVVFIAMLLLGLVSMWTTYVSLHDSILPEPSVEVNLGNGLVWDCSVLALLLSIAIGMMLFALKVAIIDGQKRLNIVGVVGLTFIAFISISFNLDVLYRTADKDFFIRYSTDRVRSVYENYLAEVQSDLVEKRDTLRKTVAKQEGELAAEIRGLREAPEGYGRIAKQEDYELTLLEKTTAVELESVDEALANKEEADTLLRAALPKSVDEIDQLQNELRVIVKNAGVVSGLPLPEVVRTESPLFAVFAKLFDYHNVGIKEIFFLVIAFFLDLGDIIGYSLVPNKPRKNKKPALAPVPDFMGPERVMRPQLEDGRAAELPQPLEEEASDPSLRAASPANEAAASRRSRRPFNFRRK